MQRIYGAVRGSLIYISIAISIFLNDTESKCLLLFPAAAMTGLHLRFGCHMKGGRGQEVSNLLSWLAVTSLSGRNRTTTADR